MPTVLITGAAGFIGSAVANTLLNRGDTVIGVDDFNDYYSPALKERRVKELCSSPRFTLVRADIRNAAVLENVFKGYHINQVCHLAARAGVRASLEDPVLYASVNVVGTQTVLESARRAGVMDFIYASSSSVYGDGARAPFKEDQRLDTPLSPYAATKKATELLAYTYHRQYGMRCTGLRYFTVYGPWGRPDMALYLFTDAIANGRPIKVYNEGKMQRDFTFIADIVQGTVAALDSALPYELVNLGNSLTVPLLHFIKIIERALGTEARKEFLPLQPGDVIQTHADTTRAQRLFNFQATTPVEVGIPAFVAWYQKEGHRYSLSA